MREAILYYYCYIFAALGLHRCAQAFSSYSEQGRSLTAVRGLVIAGASLVAEHRLSSARASAVVTRGL